MKKIALLLSVLLVVFSSCSTNNGGNNSPTNPTNNVLVKKIIKSDSNANVLTTTSYAYDGNKIVSESVKENSISMGVDVGYNYRTDYIYTGSLISAIKVKMIYPNLQEKLMLNTDFVYDSSGNLTSSSRVQYFDTYQNILKILYTQIDNNTQQFKMSLTDSRDNIENPVGEGKIVFDANRNIIKMGSPDVVNAFSSFDYDSKSNPKKNILGFNKIIFFDLPPNFNVNPLIPHLDRSNNILKSNIPGYYPTNNQSVYNADGYPTEMKQYIEYLGNNNLDVTFQYFY